MRRLAPWLGLAGLAALVFGSACLERRELPPSAMAALAVGLLIWVVVARIDPPPADVLGALDPPARGPRAFPLLLALVASGVCWWQMPPEVFRVPGVAAWVAAIGCWFWAW